MSSDPLYIRILEKLGVNTTRLKWKLYQKEQQMKNAARTGVRPTRFEWLSYPHKICSQCGAINDSESRQCHSCQAKLPPVWLYRLTRLFSSMSTGTGPLIVPAFLGLMIMFFAIEISLGGFSMEHLMSPNHVGMIILGAFTADIFTGPFHAFRWMAFGLLHGGLIHIGFNGYALRNIGPAIEGAIGRVRMLVLITIGQLGSATAAYIQYFMIEKNPNTIVIGASGWLFAIIGFGIIFFHQRGHISIRNQLLFWSGLMLLLGFTMGGISNSAHIGGMVAGMVVAVLPEGGNARRPEIDRYWNIAAAISVLLWVATIIGMVVSLGINGPKYF
ncbi:MAG: rhomboid family intramembrane serine protease [Candidatus Hydrogenedentota bacterium]